MKLTFTLMLSVIAMLGMNAQVIWGGPGDPNGEFAGGLNDWTTVGISSAVADSAANAVWVWDEDGTPNEGAYTTSSGQLASPSAANGAASFHSDFLDNAGVQDSFGTGAAPSPHKGELISPVIDLSAESSPTLTFYQRFVNFNATTTVSVSGDGGQTFTDFPLNSDVEGNASSGDIFTNINIADVAGNSDNVVIKFTFEGDYYYWIIDDVSIISLPSNDLAIDELGTFYSPASAVQPACSFDEDLILFTTNVTNAGSDTITNLVYKATVYNDDSGELIYSDSIIVSDIAPDVVDSSITITELWDPEVLEEGIYIIVHEVYNLDNLDDFNSADNEVVQVFEINNMSFAKEITGNGDYGWWNNGGFNAYGVFYTLGSNCMENYTISSVDYSVGRVNGDAEPLEGREMEFWLWKMNSLDINEFSFTTDYIESSQTVSHPSMEFVAFAPDAIDADDTGEIFSSDAQFLNVDADPITPILEPGSKYGLFAHWGINGTTSPLHLMNEENSANDFVFYVESDGRFYTGFLDNLTCPILRMQLELFSSVDNQPLAESAFTIYPNPTSGFINLDINLEKASNATVTIADITGKVLKYQDIPGVQQETVSLNVSNFVPGNYIARIATDHGTKTLKFIVQ